jgi:formate-dependent nitrite reductase membrane component NrfD
LLHPEWSERAPWFGYIGVGIALAAMLLGIAGMAMAVMYLWRWTGS